MSAAVLAKRDIAVDQRGLGGRKLCRAEIFLAQKSVHRTRADGGQKCALRVDPSIPLSRSATDENGSRRAHRYQLVRIHR